MVNNRKVSDRVAEWLQALDIGDVFSVTGGGSLFLNDAIFRLGYTSINYCHNEQAVGFAAEGFARSTDGFGVCLVTLGPGASNLLTSVLSAWMDSVKVLIISGQSFSTQVSHGSNIRQLGIQEFDLMPMIEKCTKYSHSLNCGSDIDAVFSQALSAMSSGRPGPVWIEIPADVQNEFFDGPLRVNFTFEPNSLESGTKPLVNRREVRTVIDALTAAKRPLIHIGNGVRISKAEELIRTLYNETKIPLMITHNSVDLFRDENILNMGFSGVFGARSANIAAQNCDFYLGIGTRLSLAQTGYNGIDFARNAFMAVVDIDPNELTKDYLHIDVGICSDAKDFLIDFLDELDDYKNDIDSWIVQCQEWKRKYDVLDEIYTSEWVNSYDFVKQLSNWVEPGESVVTDMGLAYQSTFQSFRPKPNVRLITNTGFAPMGWGLPGAIGVCIARGTTTYCLAGDGGFMMNLQELATLKHLCLPVKIFIFNNGGYLTIRDTQSLGFDGRHTGVDKSSGLDFPDFCLVAESFGISTMRQYGTTDGLLGCLEFAKSIDGPVLIDLVMDPNQIQSPKVINRRDGEGKFVSSRIEDMWPFLSREAIKAEMSIYDLKQRVEYD